MFGLEIGQLLGAAERQRHDVAAVERPRVLTSHTVDDDVAGRVILDSMAQERTGRRGLGSWPCCCGTAATYGPDSRSRRPPRVVLGGGAFQLRESTYVVLDVGLVERQRP